MLWPGPVPFREPMPGLECLPVVRNRKLLPRMRTIHPAYYPNRTQFWIHILKEEYNYEVYLH